MSISVTVENASIKLPPDVHLPDGTKVEIIVTTPERKSEPESPLGWMAEFAGCIKTLPPDMSARHTEYAHGRKRRPKQ